jgi:hypothetical protein
MDTFHVGLQIRGPVKDGAGHALFVGGFAQQYAVSLLLFGLDQLQRREGEARLLLPHVVDKVHAV